MANFGFLLFGEKRNNKTKHICEMLKIQKAKQLKTNKKKIF